MHKPVGYVTSRRKELMGDGKFIFELLPESFLRRKPPLVPAGRLDKWASGAIICTQNGMPVNVSSSAIL
jgi:16S rRNA pseudouridine516 synthase